MQRLITSGLTLLLAGVAFPAATYRTPLGTDAPLLPPAGRTGRRPFGVCEPPFLRLGVGRCTRPARALLQDANETALRAAARVYELELELARFERRAHRAWR